MSRQDAEYAQKIILRLLLLVALLALLILYFWVHKPFDPLLALKWIGAPLDILTVGLLVSFTGGIGRRVLLWIAVKPFTTMERVALESGVGLGLYSLITLLLGMMGFYNRIALWSVLILLAVLCIPQVVGWIKDFRYCLYRAFSPPDGWTRFLGVVAWVTIFTVMLFALAPPVGWDSLAYHLISPQKYLEAGKIAAHPDNFYLGLSQNVEMLYGVVMSLFGRDTAAAPLHVWFTLMGVLAVAGLVRRYTDVRTGWIAVILPLSSFSVWVLMGYAYVDLAVMCFSALALVSVIYWRDSLNIRWLVVTGVCIGFAMGVKYTAGILLISVGLLIVYTSLQEKQLKDTIKPVLFLGIAAGITFLPWMIKGTVLYENPIYPFLFDGVNWDSHRADFFNPPDSGLIDRGEAWQAPIIPLAATVFGVEHGAGYAFTAGLWLLTAPVLLLFGWGRLSENLKRLALYCVVLCVPLLLFWMVMALLFDISMQTRLMTMLFPTFIVLGALGFYGLAKLPVKPLDVNFILRVIFAMTLVLGILDILRDTAGNRVLNYHFTASYTRDNYLLANGRVGSLYNAILQMRTMLEQGTMEAGSQIRLMWEPKGYYCPKTVECTADVLLDHWRHAIVQGETPDDILEGWRNDGDDYLLVFETGFDFLRRELAETHPGSDLFLEALEKHTQLVWTDGSSYALYTWQTSSP